MRLFKIDEQVGRKSILSNQSILPCSEESFASRSNLGSFASFHREPPVANAEVRSNQLAESMGSVKYSSARRALQAPSFEEAKHSVASPPQPRSHKQAATFTKQSTHSYDFRSSERTISTPPDAGSLIENLHEVASNLERRKRELELNEQSRKNSDEEEERHRQALINAEVNKSAPGYAPDGVQYRNGRLPSQLTSYGESSSGSPDQYINDPYDMSSSSLKTPVEADNRPPEE